MHHLPRTTFLDSVHEAHKLVRHYNIADRIGMTDLTLAPYASPSLGDFCSWHCPGGTQIYLMPTYA